MAKQTKKLDVMKTSTPAKKKPGVKITVKDNISPSVKKTLEISQKLDQAKSYTKKTSQPKVPEVKQKISFFNVPKNPKRFENKKK